MTAYEFIQEIRHTRASCEMVIKNTSRAWHGVRLVLANWRLVAILGSFYGNWTSRAIHCGRPHNFSIWNSKFRFITSPLLTVIGTSYAVYFLPVVIIIQLRRLNGITREVCWRRRVSATQMSSFGRSTLVDVFHSNASECRALCWNGRRIAIGCVHRPLATCFVFGTLAIGSRNVGPFRMGRFNRLRGRHARTTSFSLSQMKQFCIDCASLMINCIRVSFRWRIRNGFEKC